MNTMLLILVLAGFAFALGAALSWLIRHDGQQSRWLPTTHQPPRSHYPAL